MPHARNFLGLYRLNASVFQQLFQLPPLPYATHFFPEVLGEEDEDEDEQEEAELASVATSLSWMTTTSSATRKAEEASVAETPDDREARLALEAERRKWHEALGLVQSHERARIGRRLAITGNLRACSGEDLEGQRGGGCWVVAYPPIRSNILERIEPELFNGAAPRGCTSFRKKT